MDPYLGTLYQIVSAGQKTNSYKFALWRALAALAPQVDFNNPIVSKSDLAPFFVEYYWPLEVKYHIRQSIDPDKDPIVMRYIRQLLARDKKLEGMTFKEFVKAKPKDFESLIITVARNAFDDVIPRFHNVRGEQISPKIFEFSGHEGSVYETITLTNGGREFLINYRKLIDFVAVSGWVRFTERFTSAPRLHDKIDGAGIKRQQASRWKASLAKIQNGKCFYDAAHDMSSPEVDHVIPWSFLLEDKTWNFVLACRQCNNSKRDRLTDVAAIERLCERNAQVADGAFANADPSFRRHFAEWGSRDLGSHLKGLYDQAAADGFPKWE